MQCRPRPARRDAVTGPAPGSLSIGSSSLTPAEAKAPRLPEGKPEMIVADRIDVTLFDLSRLDALAVEVDAVGRPQILDVVRAGAPDHGGVLARDVAVADGADGGLGPAANDELVLVHDVSLVAEDQIQGRSDCASHRGRRHRDRRG